MNQVFYCVIQNQGQQEVQELLQHLGGGHGWAQGPGKLRHFTTGHVCDLFKQGDIILRWGRILGWLRHLLLLHRPTGHSLRQGELVQGLPPQGGPPQGGPQQGGLRHGIAQGEHGLHGLQGLGKQHIPQGLLHGDGGHGWQHGGFPQGGLPHLGLQHTGLQTIILQHDLHGPHGLPHGGPQGAPHGGLAGGGVHSNINSFLAKGAPVNRLITSSNTPRRGLFTLVSVTCALSSDLFTVHFGPPQGCNPCTGHGDLGPIHI